MSNIGEPQRILIIPEPVTVPEYPPGEVPEREPEKEKENA